MGSAALNNLRMTETSEKTLGNRNEIEELATGDVIECR
jgi:hypothetical protein